MTKVQKKQANEVLTWLRKEWGIKKKGGCGCKDKAFGCPCCEVTRLTEQLDSLVNFYMDESRQSMRKSIKDAVRMLK